MLQHAYGFALANKSHDTHALQAYLVAAIGERVTTGVAEHVWVRLEAETGGGAGAFDHAGEPGGRERRAALGGEHEIRLLFAGEAPQGS
jgi:hypothetical protein